MRDRLQDFLRQHNTLTLATLGPAGEPQAAAVFYVTDDELNIFFLSNPESRHGLNLSRQPRVAATIQADGQDWQEITGLQFEGTAVMIEGARDNARVTRLFAERFDFLRALRGDEDEGVPVALRGPLANSRFYVLRPAWIRLIDNRLGFGHKEELTL